MLDASLDLQKALYAQLRSDAAIIASLGAPARVYDAPPPETPFPYVTLGEGRTRAFSGLDGAYEHEVRIFAYSRYAGRLEVKTILGAVYDALHDAPLALSEHQLVSLRFVFADAFRRLDGETYQGVARFRAVTEPQ